MLAAPACGSQQLVHALRFLASPSTPSPAAWTVECGFEDADQSTVRYVEEWTTEEAMRLRVRSDRFTRLLEVMESAPEAPSVQFDFVRETRGLDFVAEVRDRDGVLADPASGAFS